jgi:peptidoglycan/LPS O-acetylase OafA/YrhL
MKSLQQTLLHPKYRPDIDGLRALAVLSVVMFHAFPSFLRGGFIGVDVFFVISGFLISTIIFESLGRGGFNVPEFYVRRIVRIFPALILVLVASYAIGWFILLADEYKQLGKHIAGGVGFISNFVLLSEAGYFDNAADTKPLLHLWSLGIEEQFYIIWPPLLWFAWKRKFNLLALTILIALLSFYLNVISIFRDSIAIFYSPQTRFWELLCGGLLAWIYLQRRDAIIVEKQSTYGIQASVQYRKLSLLNGKALSNMLSVIGFFLLAYGFWRIDKELVFPGVWAVIPVLGAVLIISAGPNAYFNRTFLSNKIVVWLGLISFPLYLWHWPLLSFLRIVEGEYPSAKLRIAAISISVLLAWLTYKFVERPLRRGSHSVAKIAILILAMTITGCIGYETYRRDGLQYRKIAMQARDFDYKADIEGYSACNIQKLKTIDGSLNYCLVNPHKKTDSVIIGDSHAEDKFHGLVDVDKNSTWMLIGNTSCPPLIGVSVEGDQKACENKFKLIFEYLADNKNIENVALSFYGNYFKTDVYAADHVKRKTGESSIRISSHSALPVSREEMFFSGLDQATRFLIANGKKVTIFIDVPELPFFPKDCFRNAFKRCEISRDEVMVRQAALRRIIARLRISNPEVKIFDPIGILCTDIACGYKKDGVIMYRDSHHLSLRGSRLYAESFIAARDLERIE